MEKKASIGEAAFSFLMKKKKGKDVISYKEFFPAIDYTNEEDKENKWYIKDSYRARLYEDYLKYETFQNILSMIIKDFKKCGFPEKYKPPVNGKNENSPEITALMLKYRKTLSQVFEDAHQNKEAFIVEVNGFTGSGKSRYARGLIMFYARTCKKNFWVHCDVSNIEDKYFVNLGFTENKPFDVYVTYRTSESNDIIKNIFQEGDVILQDEMPIQHGYGSQMTKDDLVNIIKVASRKKNINMIFITPNLIELDNVDYFISIIGINKRKALTLAVCATSEKNYVGASLVNVWEDPNYTKYYEEVSKRRKEQLMESGGYAGVSFDDDKKIPLVDLLVKKIQEKNYPIRYRKDVEVVAISVPEVVNCMFKDIVIQDVYNIFKNNRLKEWKKELNKKEEEKDRKQDEKEMKKMEELKKEDLKKEEEMDEDDDEEPEEIEKPGEPEKQESSSGDFTFDIDDLLKSYQVKRDIEIYKRYMKGETNDELALEYNLKNPSSISRAVGKVSLWISQKIGHVYEKYVGKKYRANPKVERVVVDGRVSEPDVVVYWHNGNITVLSVKCFNTTRGSTSIKKTDIIPEMFFCKKIKKEDPNKNVNCILHVYNLAKKAFQEIDIDYYNPRETYNFSLN